MRFTLPWLRSTLPLLAAAAADRGRPVPGFAPRISLQLTEQPITATHRLAGVGSLDQVIADLHELRALGADTVVLDPFNGDPETTRTPAPTWQLLDTVMTAWSKEQLAAAVGTGEKQ